MGIINFFRSFTNVEILYEEIINAQRKAYDNIKKDYIRRNELYDNHLLLAEVWASRKRLYIKTSMENLYVYGILSTFYISLLDEETSIKALGACFFIEESNPRIKETPTFDEAKHYYINTMLQKQHIIEDDNKLEEHYKEKNPVVYAMIKESHGSFKNFIQKSRMHLGGDNV